MNTKRWIWIGTTVLALAGCGGAGDSDDGDDYASAIPDSELLALAFDDPAVAQGALTSEDGPLLGEPSQFKEHAKKLMDGLNKLGQGIHDGVAFVKENSVPIVVTKGALTCKVWEADGAKAHWQLLSCLVDKKVKKFTFLLRGRPLGSTAEKDYLPVFAGDGIALPKFEGHRRGFGWAGFQFDHYATLTGEKVSGKMGIAYRGAGKARQLVIGLNKVQGPNMTEPVAGIYRFVHVLGLGGRFSFVGPGDFVAPDAEGKIRPGKDGTMEMGRAVLAWKKAVGARTVLEACGGSVGQGKCVRLVQCWKPDDSVAFEDVAGNGGIAWDKVQCPDRKSVV